MLKNSMLCLVLMTPLLVLVHAYPEDVFLQKKQILSLENKQRTGGTLELTPDEVKVNEVLMHEKWKEIERTRLNGSLFPPAVNFMISKLSYEESKVFQIIRKMPKGGSLHLHERSVPSIDWILKNLIYHPNCYMCTGTKGTPHFHFWQAPTNSSGCQWQLVSELRQRTGNRTAFDESMYARISFNVKNPGTAYVTNRDAWVQLSKAFDAIQELISFAGTMKEKMYQVLKEAHEDNVMYLEIRRLSPVYDLDGNILNRESVLKTYKEVVADFRKTNPNFFGVKYILTASRKSTKTDMRDKIKEAIDLRQKYPDDIAGFDIDTDEDRGPPTMEFMEELLHPSTHSPPVDLPYFFHAGETDWTGTAIDNNLLDAILLGTKRIGHGIALHGHPEFLRLVKEKDIAIEVNPISNQVLRLIEDLRLHPAVSLIAQNFSVVISSDSPNTWNALPASHDFYAAFMALGGAQADLRFLKQLAINSIMYSAMSEDEKRRALDLWRNSWDIFIADIVKSNY